MAPSFAGVGVVGPAALSSGLLTATPIKPGSRIGVSFSESTQAYGCTAGLQHMVVGLVWEWDPRASGAAPWLRDPFSARVSMLVLTFTLSGNAASGWSSSDPSQPSPSAGVRMSCTCAFCFFVPAFNLACFCLILSVDSVGGQCTFTQNSILPVFINRYRLQ